MVNIFSNNAEQQPPLDEQQQRRVEILGMAMMNIDQAVSNTLPYVYFAENQGVVTAVPVETAPTQQSVREATPAPLSPDIIAEPSNDILHGADPSDEESAAWLDELREDSNV